MSSPDILGEIRGRCQLVVLNTMVHSSQKFILADPINLPVDCLKSCALISESQCLVFTDETVIVVSLTDKTQKQLYYPQKVPPFQRLKSPSPEKVEDIAHSLNMMVDGKPCFIIATNHEVINRQIKTNIEKQYPAQCHRIGWLGEFWYLNRRPYIGFRH